MKQRKFYARAADLVVTFCDYDGRTRRCDFKDGSYDARDDFEANFLSTHPLVTTSKPAEPKEKK